ncbi:MAG: FMN-binding protein [Candidatus Latescibacterota bacterium]|nr:MAG: FMN-binding protein [Candidatus Latescibacterota bacterium]
MNAAASDKTTATAPMPPTAGSVSSSRMVATMGAIGVACGILIVLTFQLTLPRITSNKIAALEKAIFEVVPGAEKKTTFKLDGDTLVPLEGEDEAAVKYYACYGGDNRLVGVAMEASGQGFADIIKVLYGYSPGKEAVVGIKVLESKETPGLGDKIEKDPNFIANFDSLDVRLNAGGTEMANPIVLVKPGQKTDMYQIESITGATISSRAITNILSASTAVTVPVITQNLQALENGAN